MKLKIDVGTLKSIVGKANPKDSEYLSTITKWYDNNQIVEVNLQEISNDFVLKLEEVCKNADDKIAKGALQNIGMYKKIIKNVEGITVGNLKQLETALVLYIKKHTHKFWLGSFNKDNQAVYFVVTKVYYMPPDTRASTPASVTINMEYSKHNKKERKSITLYLHDVINKTISEILKSNNIFTISKDDYDAYDAHIRNYIKITKNIGEQYVVVPNSIGMYQYSAYNLSWSKLEEEGMPHRLVVDEEDRAISSEIYTTSSLNKDDDDVADNDISYVPIHPYVEMFNLKKHVKVYVHVSLLVKYVYDDTLVNKLILPKSIRDILDIMTTGQGRFMNDIIKGKSGGIIVMLTGDPGTGKTLTAEVYSEIMKRPLYSVQCSQLGTNPQELESKLEKVLSNSNKWNAILLIDEADVYIRSREKDIHQNAIVGVFLRILEYHSGTIFMTSNLGNQIDDAIISRCTAWLNYQKPTKDEQINIWKIIRNQYKSNLSDDEILGIVNKYDYLVGRDIKTLLKLATMYCSDRDIPVTVNEITLVSAFHSISKK